MSGTLKTVKPIKVIVMMILTFSLFHFPTLRFLAALWRSINPPRCQKQLGLVFQAHSRTSVTLRFECVCNILLIIQLTRPEKPALDPTWLWLMRHGSIHKSKWFYKFWPFVIYSRKMSSGKNKNAAGCSYAAVLPLQFTSGTCLFTCYTSKCIALENKI